jgi:putative heme-binding domain-containing protein
MRTICTVLAAACALAAQVPNRESDPEPNPYAGQADAIAAGRKLFATSCSGCHGANAEGGRGPNLIEGRQVRRLNERGLFNSIKSGVPGTDMPPTNLPDEQIWKVAAFVRDLSAPAYEAKLGGNPDAGSAIFFGKGGCSGCHMIRGRGGFLGPDLTDIGALRTVLQLRESFLKPNARIVDGFDGVTVTLQDGSKISGVARNNNNYSIQILDAKGELRLISKDRIRDLQFRTSSLMPEDYGKRLSPAEISDVLAYLGAQSVRPPGERQRASGGGRR